MFNSNSHNLTPEQQRLLTMYINQYNQTNTHIDILLDMLDEIRGNIVNVINLGQPRRSRINRHTRGSNTNINRLVNQILNDRQNRFVHYNYDNPINPTIYNDFLTNNIQNNPSSFHIPNIFTDSVPVDQINNNTTANRNISTLEEISNFLNNFLNTNVTIRPTQQQIDNSSRVVRYSDINNPLSETCPISLDSFNQDDMVRQILPCGHIFHQEQFNEWFSSHVRCPVCRYDIRDYGTLSRRNTPNAETPAPEVPVNNEPITASNTTTSNTTTSNTTTSNTTSHRNIQSNTTNANTTNIVNDLFTNFNIIRNPTSNAIDHLTFDINNPDITNDFINLFSRNLFNSILNPQSRDENERFMIDPSNNILFYETIIRPPNSNSGSNTGTGNRSNNNI
jgi:hypothetical protein